MDGRAAYQYRYRSNCVNGDYLYAHVGYCIVADRIGTEELWLLKTAKARSGYTSLQCRSRNSLRQKWTDRMLVKAGKDLRGTAYTAAHSYLNTTAWGTLSEDEQRRFSLLVEEKERAKQTVGSAGRRYLSELCASVDMQLFMRRRFGAKTLALPEILGKLHILSLRVFRWEREWKKDGAPFIHCGTIPKKRLRVTSVYILRHW